ncbi:MAG: sigma-70 family RNA polymerase sigma factor [Thermincola sp.]|nr:sigma-70 family RNA polymerase sigma factor [Thermincola sp.]MDT3702285.1 sigma-70 family RNA polymerase sigma factor [Thermincola sp.]
MQFLDESGSTDEELVLLAKAGDDRAFEALLLRYDNLLSNISRKFFIQGHDSNDLLQIARIGIWEAVQCFESSKGLFRPFMGMVVKRKFKSAVRQSFNCQNMSCINCFSLDAILYDDTEEQMYNKIIVQEDPLKDYEDSEFKDEFTKFIHTELSDTECAIVIEMINRRNSKTVDKDLRGRVSIYRDISAKLHIPEKGVDNAWQRIKRKYKAWYAEKFCYTG